MSQPQYEVAPGVLYEFKTTPFNHQREEWERSREEEARAIFWEQGTGKSKLTIDTACWLWMRGLIDGVLVVAPNGVHRNWVEKEIPDHVPDPIMRHIRAFHYQSPKADTKWHKQAVKATIEHKGFAWLTISYDAFVTASGKRALIDFFDRRRLLYVLDEAHYIKSPDAERTKSILRSAKYAPFRRILTGTPIAQGPFDAYSQIKFLIEDYWKQAELSTFTEFKTHFGVFEKVWNPNVKRAFNPKTKRWESCEGAKVDVLKGYRRLDELNALLQPVSSRVTKDDVLDLPPKLYSKRFFSMTAEQAKLYKQLRDEYIVWLELGGLEKEAAEVEAAPRPDACQTCLGKHEIELEGFIYPCPDCSGVEDLGLDGDTPVIAALAITRLLRLQQITCGYLPTDDEDEPLYVIPGANRRLDLLCDLIEAQQQKTIVWARFQMDITLILAELKKRGIKAVRYDGLVNDDERAEAKALFQGERALYDRGQVVGRETIPPEEQAQVFVGNPAAGATGLTLTAAKTVIYYSNSFKLIDRLQSEDRAHRIGQDNSVLYIDLVAEDTVDEKVVEALRNKFNVASQITGDRLKEWL
ncbi:MAG: DEAD/DEAH box helicase [Candidatus Kapaibacterium sp.]